MKLLLNNQTSSIIQNVGIQSVSWDRDISNGINMRIRVESQFISVTVYNLIGK